MLLKPNTHNVDMPKLLNRVTNPSKFGYSQEFLNFTGKPCKHLTDFFGVMALKDISKEMLSDDFIKTGEAIVKSEGEHIITLVFKAGFEGTFYCNCNMNMGKISSPTDHIEFDYPDYSQCHNAMENFVKLIENLGLNKKYLIKNPYYDEEILTASQSALKLETSLPVFDPDGDLYIKYPDSIYIFPDNVHGIATRVKQLLDFVSVHNFDSIGFEMLHEELKTVIEVYCRSDFQSKSFLEAENTLADYFSKNWVLKADFKSKKDNYFMQTLKICKQRGIKIYPLESSRIDYVLFRYGETPFGGAVRSAIWAKNLPAYGKSIVFGGSAHFDASEAYNFQDFMLLRNNNIKIFTRGKN